MAVTLPPVVHVRGIVYRVTDRTFTNERTGDVKPVKRFDVKTPDAGLLRVKVDVERDTLPLPLIGDDVAVDVEVTEYAVDGQHGVTFTRVVPLPAK